jgi:O-antigen/teichoic acid export membrane protein
MDESSGSRLQDLTQKATDGTVWLLASFGLRTLIVAVTIAVLARIVTPAEFGLVAAAYVVLGFAELFMHIGLGAALVQRSVLNVEHVRTSFTVCLASSLAVTGVIYALSPLAAQILHMDDLVPIMRVMSFQCPFNVVAHLCSGILMRELKFRQLAITEVWAYLIGYGGIAFVLVHLGFGIWALVGAGIGLAAVRAAILFKLQPYSMALRINFVALKDLIGYGSGTTIADLFNFIARNIDNLLVGRLLGAGALGIYSRAYSMMDMSSTGIGNILNWVFFPSISKVQNERENLAKALKRGITLIGTLFIPVSLTSIILAPELTRLLLGPKWDEVILPFRILAVGMYFRLGYMVVEVLSRGSGNIYGNAWRQVVYAVLVSIGAMVGSRHGVTGVAAGISVALGLNYLIMLNLGLKITGLSLGALYREKIPLLILLAIIGIEVFAAAEIFRRIHLHYLLTLSCCSMLVLITFWTLLRLRTELVLGKDGYWVLEQLGRYVPLEIIFGKRIRTYGPQS